MSHDLNKMFGIDNFEDQTVAQRLQHIRQSFPDILRTAILGGSDMVAVTFPAPVALMIANDIETAVEAQPAVIIDEEMAKRLDLST